MALPRATLIEDLENLFTDAINKGDVAAIEWKDEKYEFALHAIFLLMELQSVESLPKILFFLEQDEDFLDFWIGDHITDTLWQCLYKLGLNQTDVLLHFLLKPNIHTYSKVAVVDTLVQMTLHHPEKREEIITVFNTVFIRFLDAEISENLIDSDFLGLAIANTVDCNLLELLPSIEALFNKNYVSKSIGGDFEQVKNAFKTVNKSNLKRPVFSIFELYENVTTEWAGYNEDDYTCFDPTPIPQAVSIKVNRNDPCPCGSGKKHKKCCINS